MKHLETLGRMHVNEAIQAGLASQAVKRALSENGTDAQPARRARWQVRWLFAWLPALAGAVKRQQAARRDRSQPVTLTASDHPLRTR